jgi:hydrogenase expression/formation protein HypC
VDFGGVERNVQVQLVPGVRPGNWVLTHAGFAIQLIDEAAARETLDLLAQAAGLDGMGGPGSMPDGETAE